MAEPLLKKRVRELISFKDLLSKKEKREAKPLPETAKDLYGEVTLHPPSELEGKKSESLPPLPDLHLPVKRKEEHSLLSRELKEPEPAPSESIDNEIKLFEEAVSSYELPEINHSSQQGSAQEGGVASNDLLDKGFFTEFQRFLQANNPSTFSGLKASELLEKMKEYHLKRREGKPYYFHLEDLRRAVHEKVSELRSLEREWLAHKEALEREESLLAEKERLMEDRLEALDSLFKELKARESFLENAPKGKEFVLSSGKRLSSLAELRAAVKVLDEGELRSHLERGDFASWVKGVFGLERLSKALKGCKDKDSLLKVLDSFESGNLLD